MCLTIVQYYLAFENILVRYSPARDKKMKKPKKNRKMIKIKKNCKRCNIVLNP